MSTEVLPCLGLVPLEPHSADASASDSRLLWPALIPGLPVRARTARDMRGGTAWDEDRDVSDWDRPVGEGSRGATAAHARGDARASLRPAELSAEEDLLLVLPVDATAVAPTADALVAVLHARATQLVGEFGSRAR